MNGDFGVYASGRDHRVMSNRVGSFIELGMEKEMSKWSRKVKRVLSAVGISVLIAVNAASFSMNASAATIIADSVMIRDDASTDAGIIGSLNEGDEVTIVDQVTDGEGYIWYYVQLENGNYGYVRSDLVDADENEKQIGRDEEENEPQESQEETQEETQEEASEQAQKEENAEQADAQEQEAGQAAAADTSEKTNAAVSETEEKDGAFDALTDEKSDLSVRFDKEPDGTGRWYVYNNDNNTRYRIVEEGEAAAAGGPGMWRPAAIIFGLLALALAAIAALLFKNIRDARSRNSRRRSLEVAGYAPFDENEEEEEEEEEDEFYFEDDDDEDLPDEEEEKAAYSDSDDGSDIDADSDSDALTETVSVSREKRGFSDSTIEAGIPEEAVTDEIDAEEIVAGYAGAVFEQDQADEEISAEESEPSEQEEEENGSAREDLIDQEEISEEEDTPETEADYAADDEEEFEETAGTKEADFEEAEFEEAEFEEAEFEEVEPEEVESEEVESEEDFEEDDDEDDDEDQPGASSKGGSFWSRLFAGKSSDEDEEDEEEDQDYEEDEDYEEDGDEDTEPGDADSEEDYEDEYEDDDTEDDDDLMSEDDYDDEEEEEERPSRSARRAGSGKENSGFMGFLKKLFGSESGEDEEEDYGDDEEGPVREFDEFKEYPEDIDLLPREDSTDDAGERLYEEDYYGGDDLRDENRGRLSMQRVMKNVSYKEEEADFSQDGIDDDSYDDLTESLFDDDDDMSFSFISNSRKK